MTITPVSSDITRHTNVDADVIIDSESLVIASLVVRNTKQVNFWVKASVVDVRSKTEALEVSKSLTSSFLALEASTASTASLGVGSGRAVRV